MNLIVKLKVSTFENARCLFNFEFVSNVSNTIMSRQVSSCSNEIAKFLQIPWVTQYENFDTRKIWFWHEFEPRTSHFAGNFVEMEVREREGYIFKVHAPKNLSPSGNQTYTINYTVFFLFSLKKKRTNNIDSRRNGRKRFFEGQTIRARVATWLDLQQRDSFDSGENRCSVASLWRIILTGVVSNLAFFRNINFADFSPPFYLGQSWGRLELTRTNSYLNVILLLKKVLEQTARKLPFRKLEKLNDTLVQRSVACIKNCITKERLKNFTAKRIQLKLDQV